MDSATLAAHHPFRRLDLLMAGSVALMVACHIVAATISAGWPSAAVTDGIVALYLALCAFRAQWRPVLLRLFTVGALAGIAELATDAAGQYVARSLVYPRAEPLLWTSPAYMPLSWAIVCVQIGYLAWRLQTWPYRVHVAGTVCITFVAGAVLIPFYEEMAFFAGWWRYTTQPAISHVPVYVIVFEGLVSAAFPVVLRKLPSMAYTLVVLAGLIIGIWMPVAAFVSWSVLGR